MKKLVVIAALLVSAMTAQAKVGETKEQIIRRFGADALIRQNNVEMEFGRKNYVLVIFNRYGRSMFELYMLKTAYTANDANEIVRTVLGGVRWRWSQVDDLRKRTHDGVYELILLPQSPTMDKSYRWGIALGYTAAVDAFYSGMAGEDTPTQPRRAPYVPPAVPDVPPDPSVARNPWVNPSPTPQVTQPRDPSRPPNDCAIVAAQAYAKLKRSTYWCQIMGVHFETDTDVFNHAVVFYKYQSDGPVFVYDARGSVELRTTSDRLDDLAEAVKPFMASLVGHYPTTVTVRPMTYDETTQFQPSVTQKPTAMPAPTLTAKQINDLAETVGAVIAFILIKMLIGGGIGYLIGRSKNRPLAGFWWGTLIGAIGWIIAACMRKRQLA